MAIEAHFDESGTDAGELTIAGYLFEASRIPEFCSLWSGVLEEYSLPYFHMVDCAHRAAPFDQLDRTQCTQVQMKLMRLIKRFSINGIVCNVQNIPENSNQTYLEAVQKATRLVVEWADTTTYSGRLAYFFEAGANGQGLADRWFDEIAKDSSSSALFHYAGHTFVPKDRNPGVQAADLLAWQYHNFTKKRADNDLARLDLRALLRHPHHVSDDCGDRPRASATQSAEDSRFRIETVYYLPRASEDQIGKSATFWIDGDFTLFKGQNTGQILACPNCLRALSED